MKPTKRPKHLGDLERQMSHSVGQLLFKSARLLNERAIAVVNREAGFAAVRAAHTNLFPHLDSDGIRMTELARRLGVSKQAVGQLVAELEAMGVVESRPDPEDGRAKLVRFSARGIQAVQHGLGVLSGIERQLQQQIGKARMDALRETLQTIIEMLASLPEP
jgi:DNA-binding MarR family transcriptional regulator